ncbi:S8 family serine peptidase [Streptomyces sp. NPDC059072]|uniref:S8 family serine peptidase n=1 Tax=unclassified Streptomyces TaxID=2593676 RepID=UPI0036C3F2DC
MRAGRRTTTSTPRSPRPSGPGSSLSSRSNFGPAVDIYAPGEGIISTSIGSSPASTLSGTAQAAAHVAGLAAYFLTTHAESGATPATIGDTNIKLANHRVLHNVPDHTVNLLASNNTGL